MSRGYMGTRGQFDFGDEDHSVPSISREEFIAQLVKAGWLLSEAEQEWKDVNK